MNKPATPTTQPRTVKTKEKPAKNNGGTHARRYGSLNIDGEQGLTDNGRQHLGFLSLQCE